MIFPRAKSRRQRIAMLYMKKAFHVLVDRYNKNSEKYKWVEWYIDIPTGVVLKKELLSQLGRYRAALPTWLADDGMCHYAEIFFKEKARVKQAVRELQKIFSRRNDTMVLTRKQEEIIFSLGGVYLIPESELYALSKALSLLPEEVINFATNNILFISPETSMYLTFNHPFFQDQKGFILLSSDLWKKRPIEIAFTVAHEVAHAYMKDEIKSWDDMKDEIRTPNEIKADKTAVEWLSKSYDKKSLRKLCSYWK